MQKFKKITDHRVTLFLFFLCWFAYFMSYIGRLNYSSAMPEMLRLSVLDKSQAGFISMSYFFAYGIGQLINGFLGDKMHPRKMIFTGLFLAGVMNIVMGFLNNFGTMAVFWCTNGFLQSMIWPPILRIFAEMLNEETRVRYSIHITSTMALGTLTSYVLSAIMLELFGWRAAFFAAAIVMCGVAVVFQIRFRVVEQYASEHGEPHGDERGKDGEETSVPFSKVLIGSGLFMILIPVIVHGVLKDGVTSWVPTYIQEIFHTSSSFSILITTVLPIVNLTGAYAAQFMYQKFFRKQEIRTVAFFFVIATGALLGLWKFGDVSVVVTVVLLGIITASMMAVNTLVVNLLPLHFVKMGRAATVSGFLNSMAYLGTAISTFTIGIMVESSGWNRTIFGWFIMTAAAMVICFLLYKKKFE